MPGQYSVSFALVTHLCTPRCPLWIYLKIFSINFVIHGCARLFFIDFFLTIRSHQACHTKELIPEHSRGLFHWRVSFLFASIIHHRSSYIIRSNLQLVTGISYTVWMVSEPASELLTECLLVLTSTDSERKWFLFRENSKPSISHQSSGFSRFVLCSFHLFQMPDYRQLCTKFPQDFHAFAVEAYANLREIFLDPTIDVFICIGRMSCQN